MVTLPRDDRPADPVGSLVPVAVLAALRGSAAELIAIDGLADVLGERHRIIANDWQTASMSALMSRPFDRAADILEQVDCTHG